MSERIRGSFEGLCMSLIVFCDEYCSRNNPLAKVELFF